MANETAAEQVNQIVDNLAEHGADAWATTLQPLAETYVAEYAAQAWVGVAAYGLVCVACIVVLAYSRRIAAWHPNLGHSWAEVGTRQTVLGAFVAVVLVIFSIATTCELQCAVAPTYHLTKSLLGA